MKKLLSLVLICAMGFGMVSCVESEESQSVAELRDAKAEQLKALVNLYNAQAEAARITAQAEAALKAAQAAYQQAQADYSAEQLAQLKKKFEIQLESLIAQYEASIAQYKYNKANYEKMLMDKLAEIEAAEKAKIIALYNEYANYSTTLSTANSNLIQAKVNLAKVQAEIVDVKEAVETAISEQNEIIAENEAIIEAEEAKLAVYQNHEYAGLDVDSLELAVVEAEMAWRNALTAYNNKEAKAIDQARAAAADALAELNEELVNMNTIYQQGQYVIGWNQDSNTENYWPSNNSYGSIIPLQSFYLREAVLDAWKNAVLNTDLEEAVATATEDLEKAETALETFKGFEADFAKAAEARAALYAYDQAYANYDETYETVEYAENMIKNTESYVEYYEEYVKSMTAQLDTLNKVDLAKFTIDDYKKWNFNYWLMHGDMWDTMYALEDKLEDLKAAQDALKAAQDAQKALAATATDAEKKAAQDAVDNASKAVEEAAKAVKAAYDKAVYEAERILVSYTGYCNDYKKAKAEWEEKLAAAKENKKAFEAAFATAKAAIATLDEMFSDESDIAKFWDNNEISFYQKVGSVNYRIDRYRVSNQYLALDKNNDNVPDMNLNPDGTAVDGTYMTQSYWYYDMCLTDGWGYITSDNAYVGPDFEQMVAHYTTLVAEAKDALTEAKNNLANANEWKTNWDAKEKELRDWVAAANERIPEIQALVDAYYAAIEAADAAYEAVVELKGKYDATSALLNLANGNYAPSGHSTIAYLIETAENAIADAKDAIKDAESMIKNLQGKLDGATGAWTSSIPCKEALVAQYEALIEQYSAQVELYTKLVEDAKAALDAAMSAGNADAE